MLGRFTPTHGGDLAPSGHQIGQLAGLLIGQGFGLDAAACSKARDHVASMRSVLARLPLASANKRTWAGLTGLSNGALRDYIRQSYFIVSQGLSKKRRTELGFGTP
jgi:hypothetical protein